MGKSIKLTKEYSKHYIQGISLPNSRFVHPGIGKDTKKDLEKKMEDKQMKILDKLKIGQFIVKKMSKV